MKNIEFTVYGDPRPQSRHRHFTRGKKTMTYDPDTTLKKDFYEVAREYMPEKPYEGPLLIILHFHFRRPKSHFGTGKNKHVLKPSAPGKWHTQKKDWDNLGKFVTDTLNKRLYEDDGQISLGLVIKTWCDYNEEPRTDVSLIPLTDNSVFNMNVKDVIKNEK